MMSKAQHNLEVELALAWERGDEYWATVTVTATNSCYHAGELKVGLPPHKEGTGLTEYLSFYFTHSGDECPRIVRDVSKSILVRIPSGKREVDGLRGGQRTRRRRGGRACAEEEGARGDIAGAVQSLKSAARRPQGQPKGVRSPPPSA